MRVIAEEAVGSPNLPDTRLRPSQSASNRAIPAPAGRKQDRLFRQCTKGSVSPWPFRPVCAGWAVLLLALIVVQSVCAAPGVTARLDRNSITLGENATLSISYENLTPSGPPDFPAVAGLAVAAFGQSSRGGLDPAGNPVARFEYNYILSPSQAGDFTIPAIPVQANGQNFVTTPLKLKVVAAPPPPPEAANQSAFLKLVVPKNEIYLGEPIQVQLTLYSLFLPEARMPQLQTEGFTTGKVMQQRQSRARVGNQVFIATPIVTFVSAVRPGQLTLGPASMQVAVPKPNARRNMFGEIVDWQYANLSSEAQPIKVLPLPRTNVPPTFNGAVGTFSMTVAAGPTNLTVGDPITVKVVLSGNGMLETVNLPNQPDWTGFKAYPPNSKFEPADAFGLSGSKTFEQVVIPEKAELNSLPPFLFSFFDPSARSYRTLLGPSTRLNVRPAAATGALPGVTPAPSTAVTNDEIVHIQPFLGVSPVSGAPLLRQPWFLALQVIPVATWVSPFLVRRKNEALAKNPRLRREREASRRIREGLAQLRVHAGAGESDAFFALLFRLLQERLGERLDLPASAITEAVIDDHLRTRPIPAATLGDLHELFQACNHARFAPHRG